MIHIPTAGTPLKAREVARAALGIFEGDQPIEVFERQLQAFLGVPNLALVNSGTTACYILLELFKSIRTRAEQTEIVLPAYTAPSLLLPIRAVGLTPVLVDIDPATFNIDLTKIQTVLSERTLAIMVVHMFGLPVDVPILLGSSLPSDIFIFEDAASSLGSELDGQSTGTIAPFGFYSLNRGKNISTLAGGIIVWRDQRYSETIRNLIDKLPRLGRMEQALLFLKITGLALVLKPTIYTLLAPVIQQFKYTNLHTHFDSFGYTGVQAALGAKLWQRAAQLTVQRVAIGKALFNLFNRYRSLQLPTITTRQKVAFNQFPIVIDDLEQRQRFQRGLLEHGIETTLLYEQPLHHIFPELTGRGDDPFPRATYLAQHLLLIPSHVQLRPALRETIRQVADRLLLRYDE